MVAVKLVRVGSGTAVGEEETLRLLMAAEIRAISITVRAAHGYGCRFWACGGSGLGLLGRGDCESFGFDGLRG